MDITIHSLAPSERLLHLYLPDNLDIDLIKSNFGKLWKSALCFVDCFCRIAQTSEYEKRYYANVSSGMLYALVGRNYVEIVDKFCQLGIFTRNDTYKVGHFTKSYRLDPKFFKSSFSEYVLDYAVGAKRRLKYLIKNKKNNSATQKHVDDKMNELEADKEEVDKTVKTAGYQQVTINSVSRINNVLQDKNRKNSDYFFNVRDPKTGRIYTTISGLPKKIRDCLKYRGERMVELDIKNCQPLLLATFYDKSNNVHMVERDKYLNIIKNDDLYEYINRRLQVPYVSRKNIKTESYRRIFYGSLESCVGEMWDVFKGEFPALADRIVLLKLQLNKSGFACKLQKKEADIVIKGLMGWLLKYQPEWGVIPIHDGVLVQISVAEQVREQFLKIFKEKTGLDAIIGLK